MNSLSDCETKTNSECLSIHFKSIIESIGEDSSREGLLKTPDRAAKAFKFFTNGYLESPSDILNDAIFNEESRGLILCKNIKVFSLCEHHLVPFYGKVTVGYYPNGKIIGLSKISRLVEIFSRRLQVQERLTAQIADALNDLLDPLGVYVFMECSHMCMAMRGVRQFDASTTTNAMLGIFETDSSKREEFLKLASS